ncbi:DUF2158 domain-containing protein [Ramlibacter monticola]|uniref:DUF2158 domain-containing protein n=1 Tax=Ramlibacter monticola TaxID=1926872 RepID=A0A936Z8X2_9BURK|nr:DUF2158 domain-containing protein [Ramlibacter monticola]
MQEGSSGPKMTVLWCTPDHVYCAWFEGSTLVNALFLPEQLTRHLPPGRSPSP